MKQTHLLVGEIVRPQGIKGEVKLRHYTDDPYRFELLEEVLRKTDKGYEVLAIEKCRVQGEDVYLKLAGYEDRNAAETLRGAMLYVDRDNALELEDNQFFIADILGAKVVDTKGQGIGTLKEVLTPGGTDVFVVKTPKGEMMFPAIEAVISSMDLDEGIIVLNESKLDEVAVYEDSRSDYIPRDV
ncbi:MAG: 16S rRNA processing protein RimM [Clostridiales bacterium]|nr:16S rRNA processing protein RimM [Clostridiales bacterium]